MASHLFTLDIKVSVFEQLVVQIENFILISTFLENSMKLTLISEFLSVTSKLETHISGLETKISGANKSLAIRVWWVSANTLSTHCSSPSFLQICLLALSFSIHVCITYYYPSFHPSSFPQSAFLRLSKIQRVALLIHLSLAPSALSLFP